MKKYDKNNVLPWFVCSAMFGAAIVAFSLPNSALALPGLPGVEYNRARLFGPAPREALVKVPTDGEVGIPVTRQH